MPPPTGRSRSTWRPTSAQAADGTAGSPADDERPVPALLNLVDRFGQPRSASGLPGVDLVAGVAAADSEADGDQLLGPQGMPSVPREAVEYRLVETRPPALETETRFAPVDRSTTSPLVARRHSVMATNPGDTGDGGLALLDATGRRVHLAPPAVTASLRSLLSRLHIHGGGLPQPFGITSTTRGEGVTYVTRSLALVLANDFASRVCLVDLNWDTPTEWPDTQPGTGLAAVLRGEATMDDAIVSTGNPGLSVLPGGRPSVSERPVLARGLALSAIVRELAASFDHVLLDLPPILGVDEALPLIAQSAGIAVVVRAGGTDRSDLARALEDVRSLPMVGTILNRQTSSVPRRLRRYVMPLGTATP